MSESPLDPGLAAYFAALNAELGPLPQDASATARRARIELVGRREARPYPAALEVSDQYLAFSGREIPVRLYRPASLSPPGLLVYLHGRGWVTGSIASHDRLAVELATQSGVAVASVHYRRAPETPFPGPADDAVAALAALTEMAPALGCDPNRIGVGGDSSGAHLAIGAARAARDLGAPSLRLLFLLYPAVDPACDSESHEMVLAATPRRSAPRWHSTSLGPIPPSARRPTEGKRGERRDTSPLGATCLATGTLPLSAEIHGILRLIAEPYQSNEN
jgi:acetyl esterase